MSNYSQLSYGATGTEVEKLQQKLTEKGYDLGAVDGIFGKKTQAAVRAYQQDAGLTVDGIAGAQTLGLLYGAGQEAAQPTENQTQKVPTSYDPAADTAYQQSLAALQQQLAQLQALENPFASYESQLKALQQQYENREAFSYDLTADPLYQHYSRSYQNMGRLAMEDTIGKAAALTGGYGSSYAQRVGQQAYQGYLSQLSEIVPELYAMAQKQYDRQGQALLDRYDMLESTAQNAMDNYAQSYKNQLQQVQLAQEAADIAYDRGYENWYNAYKMEQAAQEAAYNKLQQERSYLTKLIQSGYMPSQSQLTAAGMTYAEANALRQASQKSSSGSSSSSSSSDPTDDKTGNGTVSRANIKKMQKALGLNQSGLWDAESVRFAYGFTADEAWEQYQAGTLVVDKKGTYSTQSFDASLPSEKAYNRAGSVYKKPGVDYLTYVANQLTAWSDAGKLQPGEVAFLKLKYGLD